MIARNCLGKIELRIGDYFVVKNSKGKYEIMKNMPCHNRKHSRYGKNKKELLVILSLKDDKGEQRYCQVAPRCLYLDDYKNLTDGIDGNKRLAFVLCFLSFFVSEML